MTLATLRQRTREFLDDYEGIQRFSDARINVALNEAQVEACKRSDLIYDTIEIVLANGVTEYSLPVTLIKVTEVKYKNKALDINQNANSANPIGTPSAYVVNAQSHKIILNRAIETVTADDKLILTLVRMPSSVMSGNSDSPEIPAHFASALCYWAVSLLLQDSDPDTQDPNKAERFSFMFSQVFGEVVSAQALHQRENNYKARAKARFL